MRMVSIVVAMGLCACGGRGGGGGGFFDAGAGGGGGPVAVGATPRLAWAHVYGVEQTTGETAWDLTTDDMGQLYVGGDFVADDLGRSIDLGGGTLPSFDDDGFSVSDAFVASYTRDGDHRWSISLGGIDTDS